MSASDPADRRLALITGASAGIGQALARVYAEHGWDVALTARRTDRLEALADELKLRAGVETIVIPEDLADLQAQGLGDTDLIDLLHACAIFGWANRLMHNLGEPAGGHG